MKKFLFLNLLLLGFYYQSIAQCNQDLTVTPSVAAVCPGESLNISVDNTQSGGTVYQLYDEFETTSIGNPVSGTGGTITLPTGAIGTNQIIKIQVSGDCGTPKFLTATVDITLYPQPVPSINGPASVCAIGPNVFYTTETGHTSYFWEVTSGYGDIISGQGTASIEVDWLFGGDHAVTVRYNDGVTGCAPLAPSLYNVHVNAGVNGNFSGGEFLCGDGSFYKDLQQNIDVFYGSSHPSTFEWSVTTDNPNITGQSVGLQTSSVINDPLINTTSSGQSIEYTIVATFNGCPGTPYTLSPSIQPMAVINAGSDQQVCGGTPLTLTGASVGGGATEAMWSIVSGPSGSLSTYDPTPNPSSVEFTGYAAGVYTLSLTSNIPFACANTAYDEILVTVEAPVSYNDNADICSGSAVNFDLNNFNSSNEGSPATFEWVANSNNPDLTGESLSPVTSGLINDVLTNTSPGIQTMTYNVHAVTTGLSCTSDFTIDVDIYPIPVGITPPLNEVFCSGENVNYDLGLTIANGVSPSNFEYSTTGNPNIQVGKPDGSGGYLSEMFISNSAVPEDIIYTIVAIMGEGVCASAPYDVRLTIKPGATLTGVTAVCTGATQTYTAEAGAEPYSWNLSGFTPTSGGSSSDHTVRINWDTPGNHTIGVNYTNSFGCSNTPSVEVNVADGVPVGTPEPSAYCSGDGMAYDLQYNINQTSPIASTFSWTAADNPNVTGESLAPNSAASLNDLLVNTTGSPEVVVYTVTPTGLCGVGSNFIIEITVNPKPVASNGSAVSCGKGAVNFDLTTRITNGVTSYFSWIADDNSNVEGESHNYPGEGDLIDDFLNNNSGSLQIIHYTVMPSTEEGCTGNPFTVDITLDVPPSVVGIPGSIELCSNALITQELLTPFSNIIVNSNGLTQIAGTNSEGSNKPVGELQDDAWQNTSLDAVEVIYNVTAVSALGCTGEQYPIIITVKPMPVLNANPATACSDAPIGITLASSAGSIPALSYTITNIISPAPFTSAPGNATIGSGLAASAIQNDKWTNPLSTPQNVNYLVAPVSSDGCQGTVVAVVATINPSPVTNITNNKPTISNGGTTNIVLSSNVAGSTFDYVYSGTPQISGGSSGTGSPISQQLNNSVTLQQTVTYTIIAAANGCTGSPNVATIIILGNPTISTADSVALVTFYTAANGTGWTEKNNWLTGAANTWFGVGVTNERVTSITLSSNNLTGTLGGVFSLSELTNLTLSDNAITGNLPAQVGDLTKLKVLDLQANKFTGALPDELYSLTALNKLSLSSNGFTGALSPLVSNLSNLQTLQLYKLPMSGTIPAQVFGLTGLRTLMLSGRLNGPIPATIGSLTNLKVFTCDSCAITALPSQINTLTNLSALNVHNNNITALPSLSGLSLDSLIVSKNRLTFESLEPNIGISTFQYAPQDSVGAKVSYTIQTGASHTVTAPIGGSANQYQWKKDGANIPGATTAGYTIASPLFPDEGSYVVQATSPLVPGLTLTSRPKNVKVSSLKRDSLSLVQIYNATKGSTWTTRTGWTTGRISTWSGVTISANRVTAINLSNNNLDGKVPDALNDMLSLTNINLATNKITAIPDLTPLTQLTAANVSSNKLDFASLEPNVSIIGKINFTNQAEIGTLKEETPVSGSTVKVKAIVGGADNVYQWKRNNTNVAGATDSTYTIESIGRTNMGTYICEITNSAISGLTLRTAPHTVLASADLAGKLLIEAGVPATKGTITLLRVTSSGAYDTTSVKNVNADGTYKFDKVILDDYELLGFADTITYERALPTYYKKTILWEEAEVIAVNGPIMDLNIISELEPAPPTGNGVISGFVEEDDGTGPGGGRTMVPKRVASAGVSARRVENTGRGKAEVLTLVAYVFTDENGEFEIAHLPVGEYRLNIQYPGYPMDETSFVTVPIGTALQSQVKVEAHVDEGLIKVRKLIITGIAEDGYSAQVYPNPTHDFIMLRFETPSEHREVGMFDMVGRKMVSSPARDKDLSLDIRTLPKGNYLLNVTEKGLGVKSLHVIIE